MKNAIKFIASTALFYAFFEMGVHANPYQSLPCKTRRSGGADSGRNLRHRSTRTPRNPAILR
jgi:hypothetical protein